MKKALAMKCTQEQWDLIKGRIPEEIETSFYGGFKENDYITNHWDGKLQIANCKRSHSRIKFCEIHETFNAKIFLDACGIETDAYEITKEQVLELHNIGYTGKEELLEKWFPDAFKKESDKNFTGWVKCEEKINVNWLMYFENGLQKYGFDASNAWYKIKGKIYLAGDCIEATNEEVESALICEWEKNNKNVFEIDNSSICELGGKYKISNKRVYKYWEANNMLTIDEVCVFLNGQWATIIQPEKMTLE